MKPFASRRIGFTLIELLVVLAVLIILVALIVPRLNGATDQANAAVNANVLSGANRAVETFEARYGKLPGTMDYLMNQDGTTMFTKLNPKVLNETKLDGTTRSRLKLLTLDANQALSLTSAGYSGGHRNDEASVGLPSNGQKIWSPIAANRVVVALQKYGGADFQGHGIDWADRAFGINQYKPNAFADEYVVFGVSGACALKGSTMTEIPIIDSAEPDKYYACVLCVFRVPGAGRPFFKAQFVGCFSPDGMCIRDGVDNYSVTDVPLTN